MDFWTPEREEQLLTLRDVEHRSFGEIGQAMGISRNAAIGKYGRVRVRRGLHTPTPRKRILVSVSEGKPEFCKELLYNTTPKRPLTPRRQLPKVATNGIGFLLPVLTPPPPREGPAVGILDATGCLWPTGTDETIPGTHTFCDAPKGKKGAYCPFHAAVNVTKPVPVAERKRTMIPVTSLRMTG